MYIRLIDRRHFVSSILYIHHDEDEFLAEIYKWRAGLWAWVKEDPLRRDDMPLGRLEAGTCMIDLLVHLHKYYVETTPNCGGRIIGSLSLERFPKAIHLRTPDIESTEDIVEIKTYEE